MKRIDVQVVLTPDGRIEIQPSTPLELTDGDWVHWSFSGLTGDQYGFVRFDDRLGPFHSLRSFTKTSVFGKGNLGPAVVNASYTVFVLDPGQDDAIASAGSSVTNAATRADTSPEALVTYVPGSGELSIPPLALHTGDTASWHFEGVPAGLVPSFEFLTTEAYPNPVTGPFQALYVCAGNAGGLRINGIGFAVDGWAPRFQYLISLRDKKGTRVVKAPDPVIDNLGPPPGAGDPG